MEEFEYTKHASEMILERSIRTDWIESTLSNPDRAEFVDNEEVHYIKQIKEFGNRYLRIVVNPFSQPKKIITLFFDRRVRE